MTSPKHFQEQPLLERYRPPVDNYIKTLLEEHAGKSEPMLSYHFGFKDKDGAFVSKKTEGKGIRPSLCLLTVDALGGNWESAVSLAASIEMFHNFTLIHDDIQDKDEKRHGKATVWNIWGIGQGINAGDTASYLGTLSVLNLSEREYDPETLLNVTRLLTQTGLEVIDGQVRDISFESRLDVTVDEYLEMIAKKTGKLIETSIMVGAELSDASNKTKKHLQQFGKQLGRAFQISDDILGLWGEETKTGKKSGGDIERRKKTLPVILALNNPNLKYVDKLKEIYSQDKETLDDIDIERVLEIFREMEIRSQAEAMLTLAYEKAIEAVKDLNLNSFKEDYLKVAEALSFRSK